MSVELTPPHGPGETPPPVPGGHAEGKGGGQIMKTILLALTSLIVGVGVGYGVGLRHAGPAAVDTPAVTFKDRRLSVTYGNLGPSLLEAGAIDIDRLAEELEARGTPLSTAQRRLLREGGDDTIELRRDNALFLLDFFWALGLTNRNPVLTRGPMTFAGEAQVGRYASTAGWTLGAKPANELFASIPLVTLTAEEQERLARVAQAVYRPCCDNSTYFPDCNHGMAMLGMLTVLAAGGADESQMFQAAASANAAWYPRQYREIAVYVKSISGTEMADVDPRKLVGRQVASGSGFQGVHGALEAAGLLDTVPSDGVSAC